MGNINETKFKFKNIIKKMTEKSRESLNTVLLIKKK